MPIYKYMGIIAAEKYLENQTIRFQTPNAYNDPYEMKANFFSKSEIKEKSSEVDFQLYGNSDSLDQHVIKNIDEFPYKLDNSVYSEVCDKIGMACFSESECEIPNNVLMWAHYAESHHGIVIKLKSNASVVSMLSDVRYTDSQPVLDAQALGGKSFYLSDLYFKSLDWEYENEKRLAIPLKECETLQDKDTYGHAVHTHDLPVKDIEMVFLGSNSSEAILKLGYEFYSKFDIPVIKQKARSDMFGFSAVTSFGPSIEELKELNKHYGIK